MKLYFEDRYGERRQIATCDGLDSAYRAIDKFIADANARKPKGSKPFKSYYVRSWEEEGFIKFDVGSHTEFFLLEKGDLNV